MRALPIVALLLLFCKNIHNFKTYEEPTIEEFTLKLHESLPQLLSISDLWQSVKNSALAAWQSLKNIADRTSERISQWIKNIKIKANDLKVSFKIRIENMKKEINDIIASIKQTSDLVKRCLQKEQANIDTILKQIIANVTSCISSNIQSLSLLEDAKGEFFVDRTEFINSVEAKLSQCLENVDIEQCFNDVRKSVYDELEQEEMEILRNKDEFRAKADDILDTIANCASDGLIESSAAITNTTIQIIKCVAKGGDNLNI